MAEDSLSWLGLPGGSEVSYSHEQRRTEELAMAAGRAFQAGQAVSVKVWGHESGQFQETSGRHP